MRIGSTWRLLGTNRPTLDLTVSVSKKSCSVRSRCRNAPPRPRFYDSGSKQRAVRFTGSDGATLAGTLLLPIKSELQKVPGVVLVAGSGGAAPPG